MNLELENDINRFIEKQKEDYNTALEEIKKGKKQSCWMWYIFPQLRGLGTSTISSFYGIKDLEEGIQYLSNEILRNNLIEITNTLLDLGDTDIKEVMGFIDDIKLKSSMTFFNIVEKESGINCGGIFSKVLTQFFKGEEDENTYKILQKQKLEKENENKNEIKENDKDECKADTIEIEDDKKFIGKKTKESNEKIENEKEEKEEKEKEEKEKGDKEENKENEEKEKEEKESNEKKEKEKEKEEKEKEEKDKIEKEIENKEKKEKKEKENKGKELKDSENENFKEKTENKGNDNIKEDQYENISYNENKIPLKSIKVNNSLKKEKKEKKEKNVKEKLSLNENKKCINKQNKNRIKEDEEIKMKNYDDYQNSEEYFKEIDKNKGTNIKLRKVENKDNKCCEINCNII